MSAESPTIARYDASRLTGFARALLLEAGLEREKATRVAEVLVEGDLLGHTTHGTQLLGHYLVEMEAGKMARDGTITKSVLSGSIVLWDGGSLPGPWVASEGVKSATTLARENGVATLVIRNSRHIACLAAYLLEPVRQGMMVLIACSNPSFANVAPHGGRTAVISPNVLAAGWPTDGDPVLVDTSLSMATTGGLRRTAAAGGRLPGPWLLDRFGNPTDDPTAPTILPLGGVDYGHKGFALAVVIEALTSGLAGLGRADADPGTANVFIQAYDPRHFGGLESFKRQMTWLTDACHGTLPRPGIDRVRMPGEGSLRRREDQLANGIEWHPSIAPTLAPWCEKLGVPLPERRLA